MNVFNKTLECLLPDFVKVNNTVDVIRLIPLHKKSPLIFKKSHFLIRFSGLFNPIQDNWLILMVSFS